MWLRDTMPQSPSLAHEKVPGNHLRQPCNRYALVPSRLQPCTQRKRSRSSLIPRHISLTSFLWYDSIWDMLMHRAQAFARPFAVNKRSFSVVISEAIQDNTLAICNAGIVWVPDPLACRLMQVYYHTGQRFHIASEMTTDSAEVLENDFIFRILEGLGRGYRILYCNFKVPLAAIFSLIRAGTLRQLQPGLELDMVVPTFCRPFPSHYSAIPLFRVPCFITSRVGGNTQCSVCTAVQVNRSPLTQPVSVVIIHDHHTVYQLPRQLRLKSGRAISKIDRGMAVASRRGGGAQAPLYCSRLNKNLTQCLTF